MNQNKQNTTNRPQIDQKTLQYKQIEEENLKKTASKQQISKRIILHVAKQLSNKQGEKLSKIQPDKNQKQCQKEQKNSIKQPLLSKQIQISKDQNDFLQKNLGQVSLCNVQKNKQGIGLFPSSQSLFSCIKNQNIQYNKSKQNKNFNFGGNIGTNLFNFKKQNKPLDAKSEQKQLPQIQGDSQQLERQQKIEIDKTKSKTNYQYKECCKVLFCKNLKKVKVDNGNLMENMQMCLQQDFKSKICILRIRTAVFKVINFQGLILNKSHLKNIKDKPTTIELGLFKIIEQKNKIDHHLIKIMFEREEDCIQFKQIFQSLLKPIPQSQQKKQAQNESQQKEIVKKQNKQKESQSIQNINSTSSL